MAGRKEIPRELSIYINDRQVINSLGGVTREIGKVNSEMRNLNKNSATYDQDLKRLQKDLVELKNRQSDFKDEIQATGEVSNQAAESFSKLFLGLTSGNLSMAKEGFEGIRGSLNGLVKSALAFVATPIGAAIAVLSGIAIATKAVFDFNVEAEKSARLIEDLSGKTGQVVEDIRLKINALTDTFGVGFDAIAKAVDNLVDTGAVKDELEALELIKNGLLTAPDKNEFVTSLESSSVAAKQIGADLETVIALKQQIEETGVDPEATFGALQKASLNLEKQTEKTRKALTDSFGAAFTDEVLAKIKTGEITTIQALDLIGKKSKEVGLNQTQQAQLTTELFGKAGLAAGGFATITDTVTKAQERQNKELNENQSSLKTLADANERLGKAQSDLFRIEGFGSMWDIIKAKSIDALSSILEWVSDLKTDIQPLIDFVGVLFVVAWENLKATTSFVFSFIGGLFRTASNTIKTFVDFFKAIFKGDFNGALEAIKNGLFNFSAIVKNTFGGIYNALVGGLQGLVKAISPVLEALGLDVDKINKKLESFKSKEVKLKTTTETSGDAVEAEKKNTKATQEELESQAKIREEARKKEADARAKAIEKEKQEREKAAKERLDREVALANALAKLAKAELDYFIISNKGKVDTSKEITEEIFQNEKARLERVSEAQVDQLNKEREANIAKAQREAKSAEEFNALRQAYDLEYDNKRLEMEVATLDAISTLKKTKEEQEKQLRLEQLQYDNELALAEATTKEEEAAIMRQQQYNKESAEYFDALSKKKITYEEYTRFIAALDKQKEEQDRLAKIQSAENTLNELGKLADATVAIFGQNKASASATALINGGLAVTEILKTPSVLPEPFASISRGVQIAAAAITTAKSISQINSAKPPKRAKFFFGGPTGNTSAFGNDEFGKMTGVVHENEWVAPQAMTQSPRYAPILSYLENERQKIYGNKFADGGETSPSVIVPGAVQNNDPLLSAINRLNAHLDSGIVAKAFIGYQDAEDIQSLNDETNQSNQNGTLNS
jgi:hypothetical protein